MFSIIEYLEEIREQLMPCIARAEDKVDDSSNYKDDNDDEADNEDEDEDEEEEQEEKDPMEELKEKCKDTQKGKEYSRHYMECVERVQKEKQLPNYADLEYKEDCVEEFFHLQHYLDDCIAPRLFSKLK